MKKFFHFAIPVSIIIASYICLFLFRVLPISRMWEQYSVVYTPTNIPEQTVLNAFADAGITDIITLSNENKKSTINAFTPGFLTSYITSLLEFDSIDEEQLSYFYDSTKKYQLYYVPVKYTSTLNSILKKLSPLCGTDSNVSLPIIPVIITGLSVLIFLFFSKKKLRFLLLAFPLIFYSFFVPFYPSSITSIICIYLILLTENLCGRQGAIKSLLKSVYIIFLFFITIASSISCGISALLLYLSAVISSISSEYILMYINKLRREKSIFKTVFIRKANMINIASVHLIRLLIIPVIAIIICIGFTLLNKKFVLGFNNNDLSIPSPTEYTSKYDFSVSAYNKVLDNRTAGCLPDLTNIISEQWYVKTFLYRSLYSDNLLSIESDIDNKVTIPTYTKVETPSGRSGIVSSSKEVFSFDDAFIASTVAEVTKNDTGIERLLVSQNCFSTVSYKKIGSSNYSDNRILIVLLWIILMLSPIIIRNEVKRMRN